MRTKVEDLIGFNLCEVDDMPLAESPQQVKGYLQDPSVVISVAGMRHCQGGQAAVPEQDVVKKRMLLTETLNRMVSIDVPNKTVTVQGGATWSEVHQYVGPHGLAPKVHQSSAHFTVGGSISVNCHGRDPRWGPISNTVVSMKVLCGTGEVLDTSPTTKPDLFRAVIGGYGSCGLILEATLELCENSLLEEHRFGFVPSNSWDSWTNPHPPEVSFSLKNYSDTTLTAFLAGNFDSGRPDELEMHHAWLHLWWPRVDNQAGVDSDWQRRQVYQVSAKRKPGSVPVKTGSGKDEYAEEGWGVSEIMRAGWSAAHENPEIRELIWDIARNRTALDGKPDVRPMRINLMRAAVSFTAMRKENYADILLEYFVPVEKFEALIEAWIVRNRKDSEINILSSTVRLLKRDKSGSNLSYCPDGPMVSVALDASVPIVKNPRREPTDSVKRKVNDFTEYVIDQLGGTYYLPYYQFASEALFSKAYKRTTAQQIRMKAQLGAIEKYNPQKKFWSSFLQRYFHQA